MFLFENGALGHWMCATAIHGEETGGVSIYGSKGCLRPDQYVVLDGGEKIPMSSLVERYASRIVRDPFAHSYVELWEAIA